MSGVHLQDALVALEAGRPDRASAIAQIALTAELRQVRLVLSEISHSLHIIARNLDDPAAGKP